jgi:GDPmannose 4,6-dehydratase
MAANRALIVGIAGQDGSYLAELLLDEGYEVFGIVRGSTSATFENLEPFRDRLELTQVDIGDEGALVEVLSSCGPHEVYNLASPSFVPRSWEQPVATAEVAVLGVTALLEAIRRVDGSIRFFQASSNEIFGVARESPQTEETPLAPVSPYGAAKAYGHFLTGCFRRYHGLHASSGILYTHESPRRSPEFLMRKVACAAAAISLGLESEVRLGSLDARRDWGFAGDSVRAMWLMLRADEPEDYVVATGESHSVRELVDVAFAHVRLDPERYVRVDESLIRGSAELHDVLGDASKARERLGWTRTVDFEGLVRLLVDADVERLRAQLETAERSPGGER